MLNIYVNLDGSIRMEEFLARPMPANIAVPLRIRFRAQHDPDPYKRNIVRAERVYQLVGTLQQYAIYEELG